MPGSLTPLILMAGEGLLTDVPEDMALALNTDYDISTYTDQPIVVDYTNTIAVLQSDLVSGGNPDGISQARIDSVTHALDNTVPFLTNVTPTAQAVDTANYDTLLNQHLVNIFPSNGQFALYLMIAMSQMQTANKYINSAVNGAKLTEQTFTSMDALMSGNITAVSTDVQAWGQELINSGNLFSFAKLGAIGTPQALLESLIAVNMLTSIADELALQGIDVFDLQRVISDDPTRELKPATQKRCYDAFTQVTGSNLEEILVVLEFVTPGIVVLSDLLDLTKVFPDTFQTLTSLNNGVVEDIYIDTEGTIADYVAAFSTPATAFMPVNQAKANYAFCISLMQIKGISKSTPQLIGSAASSIEGNDGLDATGGLTEPLPATTTDAILAKFEGGTGPAGMPQSTNIDIMNTVIDTLETASALDDIEEILLTMRIVISQIWETGAPPELEIPAPWPGQGLWPTRNSAINNLEDALNTAALALMAAYPTETADATTAFLGSTSSVVNEIKQLWAADIQFETTYVTGFETNDPTLNGIPKDDKTTLSFAENLHSYGKKTSKGDIVVILEAMATDTQGGNAIIASMREGRNLSKLAESGVSSDAKIDDQNSLVEPGNIS